MGFKTIRPEEITGNVFERIGKQWMLIGVNDGEEINAMTASWGGFGIMWNKPVGICVVRPQRYTRGFMDGEKRHTFSFLPEEYRPALNLLGKKSGRDGDKIAEAGLTPVTGDGTVYFSEAELVLVLRKLYHSDFDPANFCDESINRMYPGADYHRMYLGEIEQCLIKE